MLTPSGYFDLLETFPQPGCPICTLSARATDRLLDAILYEHVTDPKMHTRFRASRGLCPAHGAQMIRAGAALGVATLYEAVVDELLALASASPSQRGLSRLFGSQNQTLAESLAPSQTCIACDEQEASQTRYAQTVASYIADARLQEAYRASDGLCLAHFRLVVRHTTDAEDLKLLVSIQVAIWSKLRAELAEFRRKYDFQHVDEAIGAEGDSWKRAVRMIGGG